MYLGEANGASTVPLFTHLGCLKFDTNLIMISYFRHRGGEMTTILEDDGFRPPNLYLYSIMGARI